ncbi:hypothetical protein [Marivivens marinus]|uniref:hypothetical protein n=1 Tax=Marivivens marinus TaxID=3110173 RepID=UPI003B84A728
MRNLVSEDLGYSNCMGPELRGFVEGQLLHDLNRYIRSEEVIGRDGVRFDWSGSCVEGHRTHWLDGEIENFSGIAVFDDVLDLIAEGWMEFIETETELHVFWWFLRGGSKYGVQDKTSNFLPEHVWKKLSPKVRLNWMQYAPREKGFPVEANGN